MDAVGTAHLTGEILSQRAVATSVSRREITEVLHERDGAPKLVLDLVAADGGEHATISMTWSRDDLERLLEAASGDQVELVFDRDELASAFGEVEAHGLRAGAAVFAVAAAGALGGGAAIANAAIEEGVGGGTTAAPITSTADASTALGARSEALNQQYGLGSTGETAAAEALGARSEALNQQYSLGASDDAAATEALAARSEALNQQYSLGASDDAAATEALAARSEALNQQYSLGASDDAAATEALAARSEALNQQYSLGASDEAAATEALAARSEALNQEYGLGSSRTEPSGGLTLELPAADDALIIGGLLLTIAGATFAVRRTATGRPA